MMGSTKDPEDGGAVAGAVFGAVFIYIVSLATGEFYADILTRYRVSLCSAVSRLYYICARVVGVR